MDATRESGAEPAPTRDLAAARLARGTADDDPWSEVPQRSRLHPLTDPPPITAELLELAGALDGGGLGLIAEVES